MKFLLTGFRADVTVREVASILPQSGKATDIRIVTEGNPDEPLVLVDMAIGDMDAFRLTSRLRDYWHRGRMISAHRLVRG